MIAVAYGLLGAALAAALAHLLSMRLRRTHTWDERLCQNPRCEHPAADHQMETPDGACHRLGCNCQAVQS